MGAVAQQNIQCRRAFVCVRDVGLGKEEVGLVFEVRSGLPSETEDLIAPIQTCLRDSVSQTAVDPGDENVFWGADMTC